MSDQGQYPPTAPQPPSPGVEPQPYPQGAYAPAPQPPYGQEVYGSPPPRKKRTGCIIAAVIVALLLVCGCVGGFVAWGVYQKTQAEAKVAAADEHYNKALKIVEQLGEGAQSTDAAALGKFAEDSESLIAEARTELDAAEAEIRKLGAGSKAAEKYVASLDEMRLSLDSLGQLVAYTSQTSGLFEATKAAADKSRQGNEKLNDAVSDNNARRYSKAKTRSGQAERLLGQASAMFMKAHKIDKSAGLNKSAAYVNKLKKKAQLNKKMADLGKKGRISAFNRLVKQSNTLDKQIADMDEPAIISDPNWGQDVLAKFSEEAAAHAEKADALMQEARAAINDGDY